MGRTTKKITAFFAIMVLIAASVNMFPVTSSALGSTPGVSDVYIRNVKNGKYIDVPNGAVAAGKELIMWTGNEGVNQRWNVYTYPDGWSIIRSVIDKRY